MLFKYFKNIIWSSTILWFGFVGLTACSSGDTNRENNFSGVNVGHVAWEEHPLSGQVYFTQPLAANILVEARKAVVCPEGFCSAVGQPALASILLREASGFTLYLKPTLFPVIVVATYQDPQGMTRVAHQVVESAESTTPILLSLERPYPPLR